MIRTAGPAAGLAASLALFGTAAGADTFTASVGGYVNFGVGYSSAETLDDGAIIRDGEIFFLATGSLDDLGLTLKAQVELELFTTGDQIDESFVTLEGRFGRLLVGSNDSAANEIGGVGEVETTFPITYFDEDLTLVPVQTGGFLGERSDGPGIRYDTGKLLGTLVVGISWQPDTGVDGAGDGPLAFPGSAGGAENQIGVGAAWRDRFGDLSIDLGAGYLTAGDGLDGVHLGAKLTWALGETRSVSLAALWETIDSPALDQDRYAIGAELRSGPWGLGGGIYWRSAGTPGAEDQIRASIGAAYDLAPGLKLIGVVEYGDSGTDDGIGVGGLVSLRF